MEYVSILQWTPFPDQYLSIPEWQLQEAEWELKLNSRYYYEHAIKVNDVFFYPTNIATRIVQYWSKRWKFGKYKLQSPPS